jgi:hypothetical protein
VTLVDPRPRTICSLGAVGPIAFGLWRYTDAGMNLIDGTDI